MQTDMSSLPVGSMRPALVAGHLYIRGSGAPDLVAEAWWLIARELARRGLRRVTGDLIADDSYFDAEPRPPGWPPALDGFLVQRSR